MGLTVNYYIDIKLIGFIYDFLWLLRLGTEFNWEDNKKVWSMHLKKSWIIGLLGCRKYLLASANFIKITIYTIRFKKYDYRIFKTNGKSYHWLVMKKRVVNFCMGS